MKKWMLLLLLVLAGADATAQDFLGPVEIEVGPYTSFSGSCMSDAEPSLCMAAEVRYNFDAPWAVGFHFGLGSVWRDWQRYDGKFRYRDYLVVGDYNLRRGKNFSFYAGLGVGLSSLGSRTSDDADGAYRYACAFSVMPRVGVELYRCVRLSAGYVVTKKSYHNLQVGVTVVFGGWKKR